MILLIQALLLALVAFLSWVTVGLCHGSWWLAFFVSMAGLGAAWFCYLVYQARHPNWWPPWDEGLPQEARMSNAFVPVFIIYILALVMLPVFEDARRKAQRRHHLSSPMPHVKKSNP
jgi:hypothetical protein